MPAKDELITVVRGNDAFFLVSISANGIPLNLQDVECRCMVKDAPGGKLLFEAQVIPEDPVNGRLQIKFPNTETEKLKPNSIVQFDILIRFPDGTVRNLPVPPFKAIVVERITE